MPAASAPRALRLGDKHQPLGCTVVGTGTQHAVAGHRYQALVSEGQGIHQAGAGLVVAAGQAADQYS